MAELCSSELMELLRHHQLLTPRQCEEVVSSETMSSAEPRALARLLLERGWLTPYQLNQVFQGRAADLVLGQYLVLQRLGEGGTGQVFKARHVRMQRTVALKLIRRELLTDAEIVGRFLREIQVVSQLTHPNVVHAYDAGPIGATHFLAMEYVEGTDLATLVRRQGPLRVGQACECIRQAALGLQHAHERGLVHRDVKPPNLMLVGGERRAKGDLSGTATPIPLQIKVLDLGLARLHRRVDGEATSLLTANGPSLMGTPDYLAPEQALDFHEADIRADVYSLGCTFHYLLTGKPPFPGGSLAQKLMRHQQAEPPSLTSLRADVPESIANAVRRMLAKEPAERFQTPAEVVVALSQGRPRGEAATLPPSSATVPDLCLTEPTRRNRRVPVLAAGALILVALATGAMLWQPPRGVEVSSPTVKAPVQTGPVGPVAEFAVLRQRWDMAATERELQRPALLAFQRKYPGTAEARKADRLLRSLPSVLDRLDGKTVSAAQRQSYPDPELVAFLGRATDQRAAHGFVVFSPDGRWLAMGGEDIGVRLWDLQDLEERAVLCAQRRLARALFTPDGQALVVFGGVESSMMVWDLSGKEPKQRAVLTGHSLPVRGAAITPGGKWLASAGGDGTLRIWDLTRPGVPEVSRVEKLPEHVGAMTCAPDGKVLATAGGDGTVRFWDLEQRPPRSQQAFEAAGGGIAQLVFAPDGKALATIGDTTLRWCNLTGVGSRYAWNHRFGRVLSLAIASDGQTLAATVGNGRLILYEPASGVQRRVWYLPGTTQSIDFAPDGRHLAIACPGGTAAILRLASRSP